VSNYTILGTKLLTGYFLTSFIDAEKVTERRPQKSKKQLLEPINMNTTRVRDI